MSTGLGNKLVGQIGEFLVCAELGRRGLVATPFSGNVPLYDVVATNDQAVSVPIQVKTNNGGDWQFNAGRYLEIDFDPDSGVQTVKGHTQLPLPRLIHVFVWLGHSKEKADRFFVFTATDLQRCIERGHTNFLRKHDGRRPRKPESFHTAVRTQDLEEYEGNWAVVHKQLRRQGS